jgi:hypothetical protein
MELAVKTLKSQSYLFFIKNKGPTNYYYDHYYEADNQSIPVRLHLYPPDFTSILSPYLPPTIAARLRLHFSTNMGENKDVALTHNYSNRKETR